MSKNYSKWRWVVGVAAVMVGWLLAKVVVALTQ